MEDRKRLGLKAAMLTLLPVGMLFPMLAVAHFGPTGPARIWPVLLFAPLAMWIETRALAILLNLYRGSGDPILLAILPLGLASVGMYLLTGTVFVLSLPAFLSSIPLT
jgi:hypothetical protein